MPKKTTPGKVTTSANFIQDEGAGQPAPSTGMETPTAEAKTPDQQDAPEQPVNEDEPRIEEPSEPKPDQPEAPADPVVGYTIVTEAETEKLVVVEVTESQRREMAEEDPFFDTEDEANAKLPEMLMALLNDESQVDQQPAPPAEGAAPDADADADADGTPHGDAPGPDPEAMTADEIEAQQEKLRAEAQALEDRKMEAKGFVRVMSRMNRKGHTIGPYEYNFVAGQEIYVHKDQITSLLHCNAIALLD